MADFCVSHNHDGGERCGRWWHFIKGTWLKSVCGKGKDKYVATTVTTTTMLTTRRVGIEQQYHLTLSDWFPISVWQILSFFSPLAIITSVIGDWFKLLRTWKLSLSFGSIVFPGYVFSAGTVIFLVQIKDLIMRSVMRTEQSSTYRRHGCYNYIDRRSGVGPLNSQCRVLKCYRWFSILAGRSRSSGIVGNSSQIADDTILSGCIHITAPVFIRLGGISLSTVVCATLVTKTLTHVI